MSKTRVTFGTKTEAHGKGKVEELKGALGGADAALDYVARKLRVRYDELGPTINVAGLY